MPSRVGIAEGLRLTQDVKRADADEVVAGQGDAEVVVAGVE